MKKRIIIIVLTVLIAFLVLFVYLVHEKKYNDFVVDDNNWNQLINNRESTAALRIDKLLFNGYELVIDQESSKIYYSVVNISNKYNPVVKIKTNNRVRIVASNKMKNDDNYLMIYDQKRYRMYQIVLTNRPLVSAFYSIDNNTYKHREVKYYIFDNNVNSTMKVIKTDGKLVDYYQDGEKYIMSLTLLSLGNNRRKNKISLFGLERNNKYILSRSNDYDNNNLKIDLFINNRYKGVYEINNNTN